MRKLIVFLFSQFLVTTLLAQTLTLEQVHNMARANYPLIRQKDLIEKVSDYSIQNIAAGKIPQVSLHGQASYQSEVTEIPIKLPNQQLPQISKDQYRIYAEAVQPITDLTTINIQKDLQEATSQHAADNLETELYRLKERVNTIYFGILLLDEQRKQNALTKQDIENGIKKVNAAIQNGTDFRSSADKLKAELLRIDQKDIELRSNRKAYLAILGLFIGQAISEKTQLRLPVRESIDTITSINRPELKAFASQQRTYDLQSRLLHAKTLPKFSLFVQGGLGRPALNMLNNNFRFYYLGGVRLNWSLSNYYTQKREQDLVRVNKEMVDVQKEKFVFETNLLLQQTISEETKFRELLDTDQQILALRTSVKNAASAQLENGVITVNDYLREVLSEENARQQATLHNIQLLQAQQAVKVTAGN